MNRRIKWFIILVVFGLLFNLSMYVYIKIAQFYTKRVFNEVKNNEKLFVYETFDGPLNEVYYVENIEDTTKLISYYIKDQIHDTTTTMDFDINNVMPLSLYEPIYVYKHMNKSSNIIQLIDFNTRCWGYVKGYVYKPTTHVTAPPDSLVKDWLLFVRQLKQNKERQMISRIYKRISPYGWYCDE